MFNFLRNLTKSAEEQRQETLTAYLDNALSPRARQAFEAQLAQDPSLRVEMEEQRRVQQMLSQLPPRRVPRNFTLDPAVYGRPARQPLVQVYPALRAATVLTAVLLFFAVGLGVFTSGRMSQPVTTTSNIAMQPAMTQMAEEAPAAAEPMAAEAIAEESVAEEEGTITEEVDVAEEETASDAGAPSAEEPAAPAPAVESTPAASPTATPLPTMPPATPTRSTLPRATATAALDRRFTPELSATLPLTTSSYYSFNATTNATATVQAAANADTAVVQASPIPTAAAPKTVGLRQEALANPLLMTQIVLLLLLAGLTAVTLYTRRKL